MAGSVACGRMMTGSVEIVGEWMNESLKDEQRSDSVLV